MGEKERKGVFLFSGLAGIQKHDDQKFSAVR